MKTYQLPGLRVSIAGRPPRLQAAMDWLYQLCPATNAAPELRLEVEGVPAEAVEFLMPPWVRARVPDTVDSEMPLLLAGAAGELATLGAFDGLLSFAVARPNSGEIRLYCGLPEMRPAWNIIPSLITPLLREELLARSRFLMHSAAVDVLGNGAVLAAPSGGGKTTTTLALVRHGARLVSDDLIALDVQGDQVLAHGLPKLLNLREPTVKFFEELRHCERAEQRSPDRLALSPASIYGASCLTPRCHVRAFYFLSLADGNISATRLGLEQAVPELVLNHTFSPTQRTGAPSILAFLDLLARVPVYRVQTGHDPDRLGRWLGEHCARQGSAGAVDVARAI